MKRKQSLIGGLDRILSVRDASDLLAIPADELLKFYAGQREISLRNLLIRICRSNPIYYFPIVGEPTYTLKGVMNAAGKGRSWSLFFLERNCVRTWCVGVHYLYSKSALHFPNSLINSIGNADSILLIYQFLSLSL